jgi:hypothetical protein
MSTLKIPTAEIFEPLLAPARYKVAQLLLRPNSLPSSRPTEQHGLIVGLGKSDGFGGVGPAY